MSENAKQLTMGARLRQSAKALGDAVVFRSVKGIDNYREISWRDLDQKSDTIAQSLLAMEVAENPATVLLLTRDAVDHSVLAYGAWKAGQTILCLPPGIGAAEGRAILSRIGRTIAVGAEVPWYEGEALAKPADVISSLPADMADPVSDPLMLVATGGSTGVPKLVDVLGAGLFTPGAFLGGLNSALKRLPRARSFIMTPLSHGAGAATSYMATFEEGQVTTLERFDPEVALWAIEKFQLEQITTVPTMMHRMLASEGFKTRNLDSIRSLVHTGGHIDPDDKEAWIARIGAEKVLEVWGSSESVGHAVIAGDEWLRHRGSVGKPVNCHVSIVDEEGKEVPQGAIGEIFVQPLIPRVNLERKYYKSDLRMKSLNGYVSFGDLGYLDEGGYLYIAGRVDDLIITGGANVYPDEVEILIRRLPGVEDCVVVGKPHRDLGIAVHAVISLKPGATEMSIDELRAVLTGELSAYKLPRSVEYRSELPRTDAGKIRRKNYR